MSRKKELKAMPLEKLKKELCKRKLEASGKKEVMVALLYQAREQEEALVARRAELKGLGKEEIKELVTGRGLAASRSKEEMIEAVIGHEQKLRDEVRDYESKVEEALVKKKQELESKSGNDLKELCVSKGLKAGVSKEDRVERLAEDAKANGEIDAIVARTVREARRTALNDTDKAALTKLCDEGGVDALVKDIMIERVLEHESDNGRIEEPPSKKTRK